MPIAVGDATPLAGDDAAPVEPSDFLERGDAAAQDLTRPPIDQRPTEEMGPFADAAVLDFTVRPDATIRDFATRDFRMPDFATPDFAMPDLAIPDLAIPDLAIPDLAIPDLAIPDLAMPDLAMPDFATPDLATPDLAMPNFDASRPQRLPTSRDIHPTAL